jgi:hypothetical protein
VSATPRDPLDAILLGEEVPWNTLRTSAAELLERCAADEVLPLVHQRVIRSRHRDEWPSDVREELARSAQLSAATEMVRSHETTRVLGVLASAGIQPVLLKGVPLGHLLYETPSLRPHTDTDLIVPRDQIDLVRVALQRMGYVESTMSDGELIFCQFQMMKRDDIGIDHAFDVHWKISTQALFAEVLTYDELLAEAVPVPSLGAPARAAGHVHALLLACIHPVMHHRNSERLLWLYDIHLLASGLPEADLDRFAQFAIAKNVASICRHQLARSAARFGTPVPAPVLASLEAHGGVEQSEMYLQRDRRWHNELASSLNGLPRWRDRARLLREVILPPPGYLLKMYGLTPSAFIFLPGLYTHRCLRGLFRILTDRK